MDLSENECGNNSFFTMANLTERKRTQYNLTTEIVDQKTPYSRFNPHIMKMRLICNKLKV